MSGQLYVRSALCQVYFMSGLLYVRSALCQVCFMSGLLYVRSARLRCRCSFTQFEAKLHASAVFLQISRYKMADRSEHVQQSIRVPMVDCKAVLLGVLGPGGEFGQLGC